MVASGSSITPTSAFARVPEAEAYLGVSDDSVRAAISRGELAAFKLAKTTLIWWSSLYAMTGENGPLIEWPTGSATAAQVAQWLRINPLLVRRHVRTGVLPGYRVGKTHRIRWSTLKAFTESLTSQLLEGSQSRAVATAGSEVPHA